MNIQIDIPENTFIISDFHFDHGNIIKYTGRPFKSIAEMNDHILNSYLSTVSPESNFIFVGDMTYGRDSQRPRFWVKKLVQKGRFIYVKGSHDEGIRTTSNIPGVEIYNNFILNKLFFVCHNPADIPLDWNGWSIHGHKHNEAPFINYSDKRINVSCEVVNYTPVRLDSLFKVINV